MLRATNVPTISGFIEKFGSLFRPCGLCFVPTVQHQTGDPSLVDACASLAFPMGVLIITCTPCPCHVQILGAAASNHLQAMFAAGSCSVLCLNSETCACHTSDVSTAANCLACYAPSQYHCTMAGLQNGAGQSTAGNCSVSGMCLSDLQTFQLQPQSAELAAVPAKSVAHPFHDPCVKSFRQSCSWLVCLSMPSLLLCTIHIFCLCKII